MTDYEELARVAGVIDNYTFVINRGTSSGVGVGDNYLVFGLGDAIMDPDSGEDLGVLEIVKGRARVLHVQERVSTLESALTRTIPGKIRRVTRTGGGILSFGSPTEEEIEEGKEVRKLAIEVAIGDLARPA